MSSTVVRRPSARRTVVACTAIAFAASALLTGCGSDAAESSASTHAQPTGVEEYVAQQVVPTTYPLELPTEHGTTTLEAEPVRVVSLGDLDDALAVGVVPVGSFSVAEGDTSLADYQEAAVAAAQEAGATGKLDTFFDPYAEIDYEAVAYLKPDVILAAGYWDLAKSYKKLSQIAPVVALPKGEESTWQSRARLVAQAPNRSEQGEAAVKNVYDAMAQARQQNPGFADLSLSYAVVYPTQVTFMAKRGTEAAWFFDNLGFKASPGSDEFGATYPEDVVSEEQTVVLDADVLVIGYHELVEAEQRAQFEDDDLFTGLGAVKKGRYLALPDGHSSNIPQPGVLSTPAELEVVLPLLREVVS